MGSEHLPLEQDKTIVEASIVWAEGVIERKRAEVELYNTWHGEHMAWFHKYIPSKMRRVPSQYVWIYTPVGRYSHEINGKIFVSATRHRIVLP